jgi:hypothetical protein
VELGDDGNYPMPRLGFISPIVSGRSFGAPWGIVCAWYNKKSNLLSNRFEMQS